MVDAADTALDKAPEAFDGVGMSITADVDLSPNPPKEGV